MCKFCIFMRTYTYIHCTHIQTLIPGRCDGGVRGTGECTRVVAVDATCDAAAGGLNGAGDVLSIGEHFAGVLVAGTFAADWSHTLMALA